MVRAQFQQKKKLAALNKTYVSNGTILFSKQYGVVWNIQQPVQASLIVTPQKMVRPYSTIFLFLLQKIFINLNLILVN